MSIKKYNPIANTIINIFCEIKNILYLINNFPPTKYPIAISAQIIPKLRITISNLEYIMNKITETIPAMMKLNKNKIPLRSRCFISYTIIVLACAINDKPTPKLAIPIRNCISP